MNEDLQMIVTNLLLSGDAAESCFYCGLPFELNPLSTEDPVHKQFSKYAKKTTQRFYLPGKMEEENGPQFVLAHSWCNIKAKPLSHDDRYALKETLTQDVHEQKSPPWQHLHAVRIDRLQKRIQKQQLKEELSIAGDHCFYCSMPFDIVPADPGQPLYRKLKMWAKKTIEVPDQNNDETQPVLAHQWCRSKAATFSTKEKKLFKTALTSHCAGRETLPWIDKKLLQKFEKSGGNSLELIKSVDQGLMKSGR